MSTQHSSSTPEESIDLRRIIETLLRRWPIIVAPLIISVITSFGYIFLIQPTVYESSGSFRLPATTVDSFTPGVYLALASSSPVMEFTPGDWGAFAISSPVMGFTPEDYLAFTSSNPVMELVRERLDSELSSGQLRSQFKFEIDQGQTISFTASGNSAKQSFLLADTWLKSYQQAWESQVKDQFNQMKVPAAQEVDSFLPQLTSAEENLAEHDLEYEQSGLNSELSRLKAILAEKEKWLRELTVFNIPMNEAKLASLQKMVGPESGSIGGGGPLDASQPGEAFPQGLIPIDIPEYQTNLAYIKIIQNSMQSRLLDLELDLSTTENRLRELNLSSTQVSESRLVSIEKAIAAEPEYLSQPDSFGYFTPNPVYLRLSQDRADTKILLDVEQNEAAALSIKVGVLREQIDDLLADLLLPLELAKARSAIALDYEEAEVLEAIILKLRPELRELRSRVGAEQAARQELEVNATEIRAAYNLAKKKLDRLLPIESQLASYTSLSAVREPAQPSDPVSQQRVRNIALAMFLGIAFGVIAAFVVDYYQIKPAPATPVR